MNRTYPRLANLMGAWFHQDYDIEGETVEEIVSAYRAVTPADHLQQLRAEIDGFVAEHPHDLMESFEATFRPDVDVAVFSGSVRAFLHEVSAIISRAPQ
jgi:hypothetical protein